MAEITLDDNKIDLPKRLNLTTFLAELQKKTKQYLYLIDRKEIGIFQNINEVKKGMWRKLKASDEICHYYIDPETEIEYIIFSNELMKRLGSFPYEGSIKKVQQPNPNLQQIQQTQVQQQFTNPNNIINSSQSLQAPIGSDFSYYQQSVPTYQQPSSFVNQNMSNFLGQQNLQQNQQQNLQQNQQQNLQQNQQYPTHNFSQQSNNPYPVYPNLNEIPRYNNIDLNETFQHFANLIQSNFSQPNSQSYNQQNTQTNNPSFYSNQQNVKNNPSSKNASNSQQQRMNSKSIQNLNRIQAFLKQQKQQPTQGFQNQSNVSQTQVQPQAQVQGQVQGQGRQQNNIQQPSYGTNLWENFSQNQINSNQNLQNLFQQPIINLSQQNQMIPIQPITPAPIIPNSISNLQSIQQGNQSTASTALFQKVNPQSANQISQPTNLTQVSTNTTKTNLVRKPSAVIPQSAHSLQTIQTESIPGGGRPKYFPPYQGKKKQAIQNAQTTQNVVPQTVENKFSA
jgi:hypothetical protein